MKSEFARRVAACLLAAALCLAPLYARASVTAYAAGESGETGDGDDTAPSGTEGPAEDGEGKDPAVEEEDGDPGESSEGEGENPGDSAGDADVIFELEKDADTLSLPSRYTEEELHTALLALVTAHDEDGDPVGVSVKEVVIDDVITVTYEAVHPGGEVFAMTHEVRLGGTPEELGLTLTKVPGEINYGKQSLREEETLYSLDGEAKRDLAFGAANPYGEAWSLILSADSGFFYPDGGGEVEELTLVLVDRDGEIIPLGEELPLFTDDSGDEAVGITWDELEYDIQVLAKPGLENGVPYEAVFRWELVAEK